MPEVLHRVPPSRLSRRERFHDPLVGRLVLPAEPGKLLPLQVRNSRLMYPGFGDGLPFNELLEENVIALGDTATSTSPSCAGGWQARVRREQDDQQ